MKKLFPLFILIILVSFLPSIKANPDIETLWCDLYVGNHLGWTRTGDPPYIDNTDGSWITTKTDTQTEGDFGFADLSSAGTITSVNIGIECKADDAPGDDGFYVYVFDGSSWTNEGLIQPSQTTYQYAMFDLTTKLGTSDKVNAAQVYFEYKKSKGADDVWIRRVYLSVDYTPIPEGNDYLRELSQYLSWTGDSYRTCNLKRDSSQGLTLALDSKRTWDGHITLTQSTTLATTALRDISYLRTFTQPISISFNIFTKQLEYTLRNLNLGLSLTLDSSRTSGVSRLINQGITLNNLASRNVMIFRTLTQGLSFLSSAFGQIVSEGAEQFLRTLTLSMSLTTESLRTGSLLRTLSQGISFTNNAIGQKYLGELIKRALTLSMNFASNIAVYTTIINEFNAPLIMLILTSIVFTVLYIIKDGTIWIGFTAGTSWAATAFIILRENPEYWPYALFFSALSLVIYWLTVVEVIELKEVPWM